MSVITDAMLLFHNFGGRNDQVISQLNEKLGIFNGQHFREIDMRACGGHKYWTGHVYAASFNHVAPSVIQELAREVEWDDPKDVMLLIQYEFSDEPFRFFVYRGPDFGLEGPEA